MIKPDGYWTYDRCKEKSLECTSRMDFKKKYPYPYVLSIKNGWLDEFCSEMKEIRKPKGYWTFEKCKEIALKYNTRTEFNINDKGCYLQAQINGWLDDICSHMKVQGNLYNRYYFFLLSNILILLDKNLLRSHFVYNNYYYHILTHDIFRQLILNINRHTLRR